MVNERYKTLTCLSIYRQKDRSKEKHLTKMTQMKNFNMNKTASNLKISIEGNLDICQNYKKNIKEITIIQTGK